MSLVHFILLSKEILVYEGLDVRKVHPGKYIFSGFPIKVPLEGGLTRAVLIEYSNYLAQVANVEPLYNEGHKEKKNGAKKA